MAQTGDLKLPGNVTLQMVKGTEEGKSFPITNKTMTIGRAVGCDIKVADTYVSNKHCQVVFRSGHFTVIDLGSLNKTRVNGTMYVQKNLVNEDVIRVGKTELMFSWSKADQIAYNKEMAPSLGGAAAYTADEDIPLPESDGALHANE